MRELLRGVSYAGFSRDIVGAGFVGEIQANEQHVEIEFKPNTRDEAKIAEMEQNIHEVLREASYRDVQIRRVHPFISDLTAAPLRSAADLARDIDTHARHASGGTSASGGRLMTPLQAEMVEDGELPEADLLALALGRADVATAAGYGPEGPEPLAGPRESYAYANDIGVLQWDIDPHDPRAETYQQEIKQNDWEYRVWWQAHPSADLLYVSMQAMREDWIDHGADAVPHPVGRSEAVNLVYDERRQAIVAIYGTVRDFRPFVNAFGLAYASETGSEDGPATEEAGEQ